MKRLIVVLLLLILGGLAFKIYMDDFMQFAPQDPRMSQRDIIPLGVRNRQMGAIIQGTQNSVIDKSGLVSNNNFLNGIVTNSSSFTTTSDTYVTITNMSLSLKLLRASRILVGATISGYNSSISSVNAYGAIARIALDGSQVGGAMFIPGVVAGGSVVETSASSTTIVSASAGSHTFTLGLERSAGGTAVTGGGFPNELWYVILGN